MQLRNSLSFRLIIIEWHEATVCEKKKIRFNGSAFVLQYPDQSSSSYEVKRMILRLQKLKFGVRSSKTYEIRLKFDTTKPDASQFNQSFWLKLIFAKMKIFYKVFHCSCFPLLLLLPPPPHHRPKSAQRLSAVRQ